MHLVYTLYALCSEFRFFGWHASASADDDARKIEIMRSHQRSISNHPKSNRSSIISRQSSVVRGKRQNKKAQGHAAPARGWVGRRSRWGISGGIAATAELQRRSSEAEGCHVACGVAAWSEVRSRCNGAAASMPTLCPICGAGEKKILL